MKHIKHILSFFLLLLQLSFANNFASVFANEELGVKKIVSSEKYDSDFLEPDFKENNIFEASFLEDASCRSVSYCAGYAKLVESWKSIPH